MLAPAPVVQAQGSQVMVGSSESIELRTAMQVAQHRTRDLGAIQEVAVRRGAQLLGDGFYDFSIGQGRATGPSVWLMEAIAQEYGMLSWRVELSSYDKGSGMLVLTATVMDLVKLTLVQRPMVLHVPEPPSGFARTPDGRARWLSMQVQKNGSKAIRTALQHAIPRVVWEAATVEAMRAFSIAMGPLSERIPKLFVYYEGRGVSKEQLEARLDLPQVEWTIHEVKKLRELAKSIRDGRTTVAKEFGVAEEEASGADAEKDGLGLPLESEAEPEVEVKAAEAEPKAEPKAEPNAEHAHVNPVDARAQGGGLADLQWVLRKRLGDGDGRLLHSDGQRLARESQGWKRHRPKVWAEVLELIGREGYAVVTEQGLVTQAAYEGDVRRATLLRGFVRKHGPIISGVEARSLLGAAENWAVWGREELDLYNGALVAGERDGILDVRDDGSVAMPVRRG